MNTSLLRPVSGAVFALAFLPVLAPISHSQGDAFGLAAAVPADFFMVTGSRQNPEQQFLRDNWSKVWTTFEQTGLTNDLMGLVTANADPMVLSELERVTGTLGEIVEGMCGDGFGEVTIFGQRMMVPDFSTPGNISIGAPDMVWLLSVNPELEEERFGDVLAITDFLFEEVEAATGMPIAFAPTETEGIDFRVLSAKMFSPEAPDFEVCIGHHNGALIFTVGVGVRQQVASLLAGSSTDSLASTDRFQSAFAELPSAEDGFTFVDMQALHASMTELVTGLTTFAEAQMGSGSSSRHLERTEEAGALGSAAMDAYREGNYEEALNLNLQAHKLSPSDSVILFNLACMSALLEQKEEALNWLDQSVAAGFMDPAAIAGDDDLMSLRGEDRFAAALVAATVSSDGGMQDDQAMKFGLGKYVAELTLQALALNDYSATVLFTEGRSVHSESVNVLVEDAKSNPFYAMVNSQRPVQEFQKYLPKTTTSYAVKGGTDIGAIYASAVKLVQGAGPIGEMALGQWAAIQEQTGFDFNRDVASWIDGESIDATFTIDGNEEWVNRIKVKDEETAKRMLGMAFQAIPMLLAEAAKENPAAMMLGVTVKPSLDERCAGFSEIGVVMAGANILVGVQDGWIVMGSSADAVDYAQKTALGELENVLANDALMASAVKPTGPVSGATYSDLTGAADSVAAAIDGLKMVGGMAGMFVPDPEAVKMIGKVLEVVGKLAPVVRSVDFFDSSSAVSVFDGKVIRTRCVTNYAEATE